MKRRNGGKSTLIQVKDFLCLIFTSTHVQLFARLGGKQSLDGLDLNLFSDIPGGIQAGNVVEFCGQEGSGKTEVLLHLIANCILPKSWKDLNLNGKSIGVVFVDTDYHFQLLRLVTIMEFRILRAIREIHHAPEYVNTAGEFCYPEKYRDYETFIKSCLNLLFIVRCNQSIQLLATILSLENLLTAKPEVGILMIDSVSAFYWIDRCSGAESQNNQEKNQRKIVDILRKYVKEYHVVLIATKLFIFGTTEKTPTRHEYLSQAWQKLVNFRYEFEKKSFQSGVNLVYSAHRIFPLSSKKRQFSIGEHGIDFIS